MSKMTTDGYGNKIWKNEARQYHRVDGPAIISADGSQGWWVNGFRHRENGPAIIGANGYQAWCIDGLVHRIDGPAIIYANGTQEWWINSNSITDHAIAWIKENNFPDYTKWTDTHKIMFRLAFVGL